MNNLSMKKLAITLTVLGLMQINVLGQHHQSQQQQQQQQFDPGYLRQYYQQLQQQQQQQQQHLSSGGDAGGGGGAGASDAAPIYEQHAEQPEQYISSGQQLRVKDTVQDQIRVQQHQQQRPQQQQQQSAAYIAPAVREYLHNQPQAQQIQYQPQAQSVIYRPQQYHHQQPQQTQQPQAIAQSQAIHRRPVPVPVSNAQYLTAPRPKGKLILDEEEEEYDDKNSSYQFGFDVKDDEFTNYQNRKEVRDGGVIKGSYSVVDSDGFIRTVKYTADPKEGFKAEVIREPTDIVVKIPTPTPNSLLRHHAKAQQFTLKPQY